MPPEQRDRPGAEREISVASGEVMLAGTLGCPQHPAGIVLFAHGSGSSRFSPRNRSVAGVLNSHGIATLLLDLLTAEEEFLDRRTTEFRFNIALLARRLTGAARHIAALPEFEHLPLGYFGASTGAAAALVSAGELAGKVAAVVSRGGRPDLAGEALHRVQSPTLLIVGGNDEFVMELNRHALDRLAAGQKKMAIVPGASHLFEEPGALEEVSRLALEWFRRYFSAKAE